MNTVELKATLPDISGKSAAKVVEFTHQPALAALARERIGMDTDTYSSSTANDAVAAKVLSFSIGRSFERSVSQHELSGQEKVSKLNSVESAPFFNIDKVVQNVLGFVSSALSNMAKKGATSDEISYLKQQATEGVKYGVEQAKTELANVADDDLIKSINASQDRILQGIDQLSDDPFEYQRKVGADVTILPEARLVSASGKAVQVGFGQQAFTSPQSENVQSRLFTTQASTISFSVTGELTTNESDAIADVINRADDLVNTFFRKDIQGIYQKTLELGYNDFEILSMSTKQQGMESRYGASAYDQVKHLNESTKMGDLSSLKAVAEYVARLMNVMESTRQTLASDQQYSEIINGLVNQMKDVQVPDLLQAINRFHAFNSKFIDMR
jgi:hypothetical protein